MAATTAAADTTNNIINTNNNNNNNNNINNNLVIISKPVCNNYTMPDDVCEDDRIVLHNILTAMQASGKCGGYKIVPNGNGFMVRGSMNADVFEVDTDDLFTIVSVSPLRIERVSVARNGGSNEVVVKVLNSKQRVMVTGTATFTVTKKRRMMPL